VVEEVDLPPPLPNEVQIQIHALGLNRAEIAFLIRFIGGTCG
jgi:NADPH:quinone reductase-like Zn-dependent oxidoreductase